MVTKEEEIDWPLAGRGARRAEGFPFNSLNLLALSFLQHTYHRIWAVSHICSYFD